MRVTVPGHTQRGGEPCPYDRVLSTRIGAGAAQAIVDGAYGVMIGVVNGKIKRIPLEECAGKLKMGFSERSAGTCCQADRYQLWRLILTVWFIRNVIEQE